MSAAQWEALCVRASGWCDLGPEREEGSAPRDWEQAMDFFARRVRQEAIYPSLWDFAGLALFARLMSIATAQIDPEIVGIWRCPCGHNISGDPSAEPWECGHLDCHCEQCKGTPGACGQEGLEAVDPIEDGLR